MRRVSVGAGRGKVVGARACGTFGRVRGACGFYVTEELALAAPDGFAFVLEDRNYEVLYHDLFSE